MKILETSPNGKLRLRAIGKDKGVVELDCGERGWVWCVYRSSPIERARQTFNNQLRWHQLPL